MATSRDGVEVAYERHGTRGTGAAATVVLVHGWAGNRTFWSDQIRFLAERREVIALDLAGHGESGLGREEWTLQAFGDDVVAAIQEAEVQTAVLVGHSMGGDAIVHAARTLGDRVAGLVWVDAFRSLGGEVASSPEEVEAFVAPFNDDFEAAVHRFVKGLMGPGADRALVERVAVEMAATPRAPRASRSARRPRRRWHRPRVGAATRRRWERG